MADPFAPSTDPDIPTPTPDDLINHVYGPERAPLLAGSLPASVTETLWADARRKWDEGHKRDAERRREKAKPDQKIGLPLAGGELEEMPPDSGLVGTFRDIKPPDETTKGTRVIGQRSHAANEREQQEREAEGIGAEIIASMHPKHREQYEDPKTPEDRRLEIFEVYREKREERRSRENAQFRRELARIAEAQEMLRRIEGDPDKAQLPRPTDDSKEALLKWHDEMSQPTHRPDYGNSPDVQPQQKDPDLSLSLDDTLQKPKNISLEVADDAGGAMQDSVGEPPKRKGMEVSELEKLYAEQEPSEESQRHAVNSGDAYQRMLEALDKVASEMEVRPAHEGIAESFKRVADSISSTPRRSVDDIIKDAMPQYQDVADRYEVPEFTIASFPQQPDPSPDNTPTAAGGEASELDTNKVLPPRWFNRFGWFRWLLGYPKLSGWSGLIMAGGILIKGIDWEIDGAIKTAAAAFLVAWAVFSLVIYISSLWDKRRPWMMVAMIMAGFGLTVVWYAYLPQLPTQSVKQIAPIASPTSTEANASSEERIFTDIDPAYLVGLYKHYSTAQADQAVKTYIGKWIKVTGTVNDVTREDGPREPLTASVSIQVEPSKKDQDSYVIVASFEVQASVDRALVLSRKERVTVVGKIRRIIEPGMILEKCEFAELLK